MTLKAIDNQYARLS